MKTLRPPQAKGATQSSGDHWEAADDGPRSSRGDGGKLSGWRTELIDMRHLCKKFFGKCVFAAHGCAFQAYFPNVFTARQPYTYAVLMAPSQPKDSSAAGRAPSGPSARRRQELLQLVEAKGQVSVDELSQHFGVSDDTIRRDLLLLEGCKVLLRTHGGAVSTALMVHRETPFLTRMNAHAAAKTAIGRAAAQLISDGETLIVNGGSTTFAFAANLGARRELIIVTNNVAMLSVLPSAAVQNTYLLAGQYRMNLASIVGPVEFNSAAVNVDTAVIGVSGLTATHGISTNILEEARMHARMIASARRTIVLVDSSKFGHNTFAQIASLDAIDTLVTDATPSLEVCHALSVANVELIVASP